jgi:hypothetical protein
MQNKQAGSKQRCSTFFALVHANAMQDSWYRRRGTAALRLATGKPPIMPSDAGLHDEHKRCSWPAAVGRRWTTRKRKEGWWCGLAHCLVPRGSGDAMMSRLTAGLIGAQKDVDETIRWRRSRSTTVTTVMTAGISDPRGASGGIRDEQHPDDNSWLALEALQRGWDMSERPNTYSHIHRCSMLCKTERSRSDHP